MLLVLLIKEVVATLQDVHGHCTMGFITFGRWYRSAYRSDIENSSDPRAELEKINFKLNKLRSPLRTAESFWIEKLQTLEHHKFMCEFADLSAPLRNRGFTYRTMRP